MTAHTAYQFLKPSLERLSVKEKEALCRLILPDIQEEETKSSKESDFMTIPEMKAALRKTGHFKNKKAVSQSQ